MEFEAPSCVSAVEDIKEKMLKLTAKDTVIDCLDPKAGEKNISEVNVNYLNWNPLLMRSH